jgi:hypothetical protein
MKNPDMHVDDNASKYKKPIRNPLSKKATKSNKEGNHCLKRLW